MTTARPQLLARIASVIEAEGSPAFPSSLAALLRSVAAYDYTVIFGYRGPQRPVDLFDDFPAAKQAIFVTDYQAGPYLLDPFYLAATRPVVPGLYRMRDLAPDRFYQGEYFRNYYIQTGLAEEIGFFIATGGGAMVVLSLMRARRPFSAREFDELGQLTPVIQALASRHWRQLADRFGEPPPGHAAAGAGIDQAFHTFGDGLLTARERQVAEYTLKGYSAEALGRVLGIAPGTVRIHRRNIYAKLRIGSQGELFARFIGTVVKSEA
jgi:DNA-binding CsgD family transcriptional regulator